MTTGGGIPRFTLLLMASLLLHLALVITIIGFFRPETAEQQAPRMVVDYLGPRERAAEQPERPEPRPAPPAKPKPEASGTARHLVPEKPRRGMPAKPKSGTPPGGASESQRAPEARQSPPPGPGSPERSMGQPGPPIPASPGTSGTMVIIPGSGGGGTGGTASQGGGAGGGGFATGTGRGGGGGGGGTRGARGSGTLTTGSELRRSAYEALLKRLIESHKEYPLAARRSRQEGKCLRRFILERSGALKRVEALSSCGNVFLDEAATRAITSVGTFPPLPDDYKGTEATFIIPITFALERE